MTSKATQYKRDPKKEALYNLCGLLLEKRLKEPGASRPFSVMLDDLAFIMEYYPGSKEKKLERLKNELLDLEGDCLDGKFNENNKPINPIIIINNPDVLDNMLESFDSNKELIINSNRNTLDNYIKHLETGDTRAIEGDNFEKLVFHKDKKKLSYRGEHIGVGSRGKLAKNEIRFNLCLVMFGYATTFRSADPADQGDYFTLEDQMGTYDIGEPVEMDTLGEILILRGDSENEYDEKDKFKPINDAISKLNKKTGKKFGVEVFLRNNEKVQVNI